MNEVALVVLFFGVVFVLLLWEMEMYVVAFAVGICAGVMMYFSEGIEASRLEREAQRAEQERRDAVPRPISHSADGCTVYAFKPNAGARWAYFTRCANSTTATTTTHEECTGGPKNRHCEDVSVTVQGEAK